MAFAWNHGRTSLAGVERLRLEGVYFERRGDSNEKDRVLQLFLFR